MRNPNPFKGLESRLDHLEELIIRIHGSTLTEKEIKKLQKKYDDNQNPFEKLEIKIFKISCMLAEVEHPGPTKKNPQPKAGD